MSGRRGSRSSASQPINSTPKQRGASPQSEIEDDSVPEAIQELITKTVQTEIQSLSYSLETASKDNNDLKKHVKILEKRLELTEGLLLQAQVKMKMQNERILDLQARSMRENLIIGGIPESENENQGQIEKKVTDFIKDDLKIADATNMKIDRAHRIGAKQNNKPRSIVVKFSSPKSKDKIFKNVRNLSGKKDLSIQDQLPQEIQERRRRLWPLYKEARDKKKNDPNYKVAWSLDKLIINGKSHTALDDNQQITVKEQAQANVQITHSHEKSEMGSTFKGHAAVLAPNIPVSAVLAKLLQNRAVASAEHNIYAYRSGSGNNLKEAWCDDGEHGAGYRLIKLLQEKNLTNTIVICTRWFGGTHIGPKRFDHIKSCADEALSRLPNSK